jgi:hypothetical protein
MFYDALPREVTNLLNITKKAWDEGWPKERRSTSDVQHTELTKLILTGFHFPSPPSLNLFLQQKATVTALIISVERHTKPLNVSTTPAIDQ